MAVRTPKHDLPKTVDAVAQRPNPRGMAGKPQARATGGGVMSVSERLAFADEIRSRSKRSDVDSTEFIRRDRDGG